MNFGEKLRLLRKERNLSQKEAAEKLNISLRTYASYELNQRRPRTQAKLKEIADFFGKTVTYLQIDDISSKMEVLERDKTEEELFIYSKLEKEIFDKIVPFLRHLGWECFSKNRRKHDLTATHNSTRIIFDIVSYPLLERNLIRDYGVLCTLPLEPYTETYYIIISDTDKTEEIVSRNPPINLANIQVKAYSFNCAAKEFYTNEIYTFIAKLN